MSLVVVCVVVSYVSVLDVMSFSYLRFVLLLLCAVGCSVFCFFYLLIGRKSLFVLLSVSSVVPSFMCFVVLLPSCVFCLTSAPCSV